jgi:hypothetical protein
MDQGQITLDNALDLLPTITDPVERAFACDNLLTQVIPRLQAAVAAVRRDAVYDATLRPNATADTVAADLGVSVKAVSKAVAEQRATDRELMRAALAAAVRVADVPIPERDVLQAGTTAKMPLMARRTLDILDLVGTDGPAHLGADDVDTIARARARAHKILEGHDA